MFGRLGGADNELFGVEFASVGSRNAAVHDKQRRYSDPYAGLRGMRSCATSRLRTAASLRLARPEL